MSYFDEHQYEDIINLPHHVSSKYPHMPLQDRAAQFCPFAALTGYDAAIKETARLTDEYLELDENSKDALDIRLQWIKEHLAEKPDIIFTYFEPDEKKSGGSYMTVTGTVKKMDEYGHRIILDGGTSIFMNSIVAIEGSIFNQLY